MTFSTASTRDRILSIARDLFVEQGFAGTSLQQIADRVGVTKAALYYHFKSKDDLLLALVTPAIVEIEALLDEHERGQHTAARRRAFLIAYLDYLLAHRQLVVYIARDLATLGHPVIADGAMRRQLRLAALLGGDDLDFTASVRLTVAFGGIQAVIAQQDGVDSAELRATLLDAVESLLPPVA